MKANQITKTPGKRAAFTLVELLVVMTLLVLLAALTLPALYNTTQRAQGVHCSKNLKQLGLAWALYAKDNEDRVALNNLEDNQQVPNNWAGGWMNKIATNTDNTNQFLLKNGQLGAYTEDLAAFKCPGDQLRINVGGRPLERVRSVAMNFYVGFKALGRADEWQEVMKTSDLVSPTPQGTFILAVQREDGINDTRYRVDADRGLVENPAFYHNGGDNLVFGDGHVELHRWLDPRTKPRINREKESWHIGPNVGEGWTDENADINWLRRHASAKRPKEAIEVANN